MTTTVSGQHAPRRRLSTGLRPTSKVLPEHARAHNRSLVLQHLFHEGPTSRADLARATSLTRVTISDLVAVLIAEGLVEELGVRPGQRVGKPAILVGMRTSAYQIVCVDLTDDELLRGAVLTLTGDFVVRRSLAVQGRTGDDLVELVTRFSRSLVSAATQPVIGVGIGSPGVVDGAGRVLEAPNRGWYDLPLAEQMRESLGLAVHVANDANVAALGEFTFGGASGSGMLVLTVGEGVGAGIMVDGARVRGHGDAAGELGHVTVVDDGEPCACGRSGCLETVLSVPALRRAVDGLDPDASDAALASVGRLLGVTLAPVVSALNLAEVLISGPADLLDGPLREAALDAIRTRTMPIIGRGLQVRMATLDEDVALAGAAVLVLSGQLGVS
ncbi:ROK family transcriptional regulator [Cellulosimicrobium arenosum]|uniref:ROK family transcriptional regulator n=1 Tax=Cellulosimicrobium arenosum TaxID=2708133 RepID=A0A927G7M0_9MICO|nr:ROK family transcriptional regulator [Cellulosimicrobium arenosum]MBD8078034.1 ROK family transcriptional regulator [Cellulosimicrobium arenosum]